MTRTFGNDDAMRTVSSSLKLSTTITSRAHVSPRSERSMFAASSRVVTIGVISAQKPLILLLHRSGDALPRELLLDQLSSALTRARARIYIVDEHRDRFRELVGLRAGNDSRAAARDVARQADAARHDHRSSHRHRFERRVAEIL